ncbi:putative glycoside hydrolase [Formosa algae]|uniref:putative glycoside hydrolase n=1 Tax=Formosa algae TaxID=225843 RepID=UPI000CCF37FF|nr:putative glycoside hydrolase [Formosa algae]PNW28403.1 hypothetical protein BKP44_08415 [Formosa algae]
MTIFKSRTLSIICLLIIGLSSCEQKKSTNKKVSEDTASNAKSFYPEFSWDATPMYYHFGDIDRVLKPDEVKFISDRTDFICIEKSHAYNELGDQVLGTKHEVEAFHKIKPETKVLFYYNSYLAWPYPRFNKEFTPEGIANNPELEKFLFVDPKTEKLRVKTKPGFSYYFDALNPDFRKWWVESAVKGIEISGADGIFIDRMNVGLNSDYPNDQLVEIAQAKGEMMAELKKQMGPDKILVGNNAAKTEEVYPHCDAFFFEHYNSSVTDKENLLEEWKDMARIAKDGKISIYRFGAKGKKKTDITIGATDTDGGMEQRSKDQLEYFHACFLIGAQPYSYFQWNWGWNLEDGNLVEYPALQKPLGAPKGEFQRETADGWVFTREFDHANVWVNTDTKKAKITWH